jgi:DNA polymerase
MCDKCPFAKTRMCAVPGSGGGTSGVVFIGEGPGANEDKAGLPFVGAAGKFLDEMLHDIGLSRDHVFITNVVKCRPPGNRDPLPEEVYICTEAYLWRQLNILKPTLLVTLGRHAMYRFLPATEKISEIHGSLMYTTNSVSGGELRILPLYHPAAALYNGGMRSTLKEDFAQIRNILGTCRG